MRRRRYFVGLAAALMAASTLVISAAPAGAASDCNESMNPAAGGNASGLIVSCVFSSAGVSTALTIHDYADAVWHFGQARSVNVTVQRTGSPGTTAGKLTIKSRPTNNTALASCANSPAGQTGVPAGNLAITAADTNRSIEFATSTATLTGIFIAPGTFIKSVAAATGTGCATTTVVTLSQATIAGGPLCPASPGPATGACTNSVGAQVLVANDIGRAVTDGATTAGSACVSSVKMNFKAADVGMGFSGGDIPDGAVISAIPGTGCGTATTSAQLSCAGCVGAFTGVTSASGQVFTLSPANPPTSSRYVTDGSSGANKILTSATAEFALSDVGMPVNFVPAIANVAGARIASVAADGSTATLAAPVNLAAGAKKFVIGLATKTAPATTDAIGTLAILLKVNPAVSPTSPPCAANKISGFQIPLLWRNPQGTVPLATNTGTGGYNTFVGGTHLSGTQPAPTSIAQFDFRTASTSFSGYLRQLYTTTTGVNGPSTYGVYYTFLPVSVGICPGTGDAASWTFFGLSRKIVENPSFTGGGGGGVRGIHSEQQGNTTIYSGTGANNGAYVTTNAGEQPSNTNSCTISSPATLRIGC